MARCIAIERTAEKSLRLYERVVHGRGVVDPDESRARRALRRRLTEEWRLIANQLGAAGHAFWHPDPGTDVVRS